LLYLPTGGGHAAGSHRKLPPAWSSALQGRLKFSSTVVAGAGSLRRETEDLEFANLAARVAAAARRVANNRPLDSRRDVPMLQKAQELLRQGAATLEGKASAPARSQHASYAFARLTNSALENRPVDSNLDPNSDIRKETIQTLVELAEQIQKILTYETTSPEVRATAENIQAIFSRVSSNVLGELGSPGDSLGGLSA
jgi:hypothetical protein